MKRRILLVDDDTLFLDTYVEILQEEGYDAVGADGITAARVLLESETDFNLAIIDERFHGQDGQAAAFIREISARWPDIRTIVATAYPTERTVEAGFEAGAFDYIVKDQVFDPMLRIKVRNAMSGSLASWSHRLQDEARGRVIRERLHEARTASLPNQKGQALEEAVFLCLESIPGFSVSRRPRNVAKEIDLVVRNESVDPYWGKFRPYILVECKNWSKPIGRGEAVDPFVRKLERHRAAVGVGLLVALHGFTKPSRDEIASIQRENLFIVPLDGDDLDALARANDRGAVLKERVDKAILP